MNSIQISLVFISGCSFLSGVLFFFVYSKTVDSGRTYLYFSLASFSLAITSGADSMAYLSSSVDEYLFYFKIALFFIYLFALILAFFVASYTNVKSKIFLMISSVLISLIILGHTFSKYTLYFTRISEMKALELAWGDIIYFPVADNSIWFPFIAAVIFSLFGYYVISVYLQFKQGGKRDAFFLAFPVAILILAALRDFYVDYSGKPSFYILEYAYFFLILLMSLKLANRVVEGARIKKELAENERRWRGVLESVDLVVIGLSNKGEVNYANPFYLKLTGFERDRVIGLNWFENFLPKVAQEKVENAFHHIDLHGHFQNSILTRTGEQRIIAWSNVKFNDEADMFSGTLSIGVDITDKINAENELKEAYEQVQIFKNRLEDENIYLKEEIKTEHNLGNILGKSTALSYVLNRVKDVADKDMDILIEGETGVGKELFARAIHDGSIHHDRPLIKVNCAAISSSLIESELFGHEKGAFTNAHKMRKGRFELADGGTLFLDEIGELPRETQSKLLRVVQDGEFERVGSSNTIKVNVKIISATNRVLSQEVEAGRFRADLYYRLSVFTISIPPLRKRHGDVPILVNAFAKKYADKHNKMIDQIAPHTMQILEDYHWPGNVRELQNVIERAVILSKGRALQVRENLINSNNSTQVSSHNNLEITNLDEVNFRHISQVLNDTNWKIEGDNGAAILLGLKPSTLRSRLKKLNIKRLV